MPPFCAVVVRVPVALVAGARGRGVPHQTI